VSADLRINGAIPTRPQYGGWSTGNGQQDGGIISEAEAFKLLGEAIEHHERFAKAIANLRNILGVRK
jgi:hypothetical protein